MSSTSSFPTRQTFFALSLAFIAFAVYASLVPFDLQPIPLASAWAQFTTVLRHKPAHISRTDVLANILLFAPVGFSLAGTLLVDRRSRAAGALAIVVILPVSLAVSLLAEFLQLFATRRVPSAIDIIAQAVGCGVGVMAWALVGNTVTRWLRDTLTSTRHDRVARTLAAYAAVWVFVNLAPFDITVDVGDLAERVRSGAIAVVPFATSHVPISRRVWDAVAEVASAIPIGAFGLLSVSRPRGRGNVLAFGAGLSIVATVELAQVFIRSHSATTTDLIYGAVGVTVGVRIAARMLNRDFDRTSRPSDLAWWPAVALLVWSVVLCAYHWLPYDFAMNGAEIRGKLARISLVPFAGYGAGSDLSALNGVLTKLALSIPIGICVAFLFRQREGGHARMLTTAVFLAACLFGVIEGGQFFLPTRIPDPTDVLVGVAGTCAGLLIGRWVALGYVEPS